MRFFSLQVVDCGYRSAQSSDRVGFYWAHARTQHCGCESARSWHGFLQCREHRAPIASEAPAHEWCDDTFWNAYVSASAWQNHRTINKLLWTELTRPDAAIVFMKPANLAIWKMRIYNAQRASECVSRPREWSTKLFRHLGHVGEFCGANGSVAERRGCGLLLLLIESPRVLRQADVRFNVSCCSRHTRVQTHSKHHTHATQLAMSDQIFSEPARNWMIERECSHSDTFIMYKH